LSRRGVYRPHLNAVGAALPRITNVGASGASITPPPSFFHVELFAADLFHGGQIGLCQLAQACRAAAERAHVAFVTQHLQAAPASEARRTVLAWPACDVARESELIDSRPA